jgi:hypothetical protein
LRHFTIQSERLPVKWVGEEVFGNYSSVQRSEEGNTTGSTISVIMMGPKVAEFI